MKKGIAISGIYAWIALLLCFIYIGGRNRTEISPGIGMLSCSIEPVVPISDIETESIDCVSTLSCPIENTLRTRRESNRLATLTASLTLQEALGRTACADASQRMVRTQNATQGEQNNSTPCPNNDVERTVSSIRFNTGYYIYHRCQMRC